MCPRAATALLAVGCLCLFTPNGVAVTLSNETLTGTVTLPEGSHEIAGVVTLDQATVELEGSLRVGTAPALIGGEGVVNVRGPVGFLDGVFTSSYLEIGPDVEVVGHFGSRYHAGGLNRGTIAAEPGGDSGANGDQMRLRPVFGSFVNEGLIEVRPGAAMLASLRNAVFDNDGLIQVHPTATLTLESYNSSTIAPSGIGTIVNDGLVVLSRLRTEGFEPFNLQGTGEWEFGRYSEFTNVALNIGPTSTARVTSTATPNATFDGVIVSGVMHMDGGSEATIDNGLTINDEWRLGHSTELFFDGPQTIDGPGKIVADAAYGALIAVANGVGAAGIDLMVDLEVRPSGSMQLDYDDVDPDTPTFTLYGDTLADGGGFSTGRRPVTNHGEIRGINGAYVYLGSTGYQSQLFFNEGEVVVDSGSTLTIQSSIQNNGSITVSDGAVAFRSLDIAGAPVSITNSTVYADTFGQTLSDLDSIPRTRSDFIADAMVDLEGATLTIADQDNRRWGLRRGGYENGVIESEDGQELRVAGHTNSALLRNLQLDADVRVEPFEALQINEGLTGDGKLILDGGELTFNGIGSNGAPMTSDAVNRVEVAPDSFGGRVTFRGRMDNTERTIHLKAGVEWTLQTIRSTGMTGGRIEADPGVELQIRGLSNLGELVGVTLAAPARVAYEASIAGGLTLDGGTFTIGDSSNGQSSWARVTLVEGDQTIGGAGEVRFEERTIGPGENYVGVSAIHTQESRLTIGADTVVRTNAGPGYVAARYNQTPLPTPLTNRGLLLAENGYTLSLFTDGFEQLGTVRAEDGSLVEIVDTEFTNNGRLEAVGGLFSFTGDVSLAEDSTLAIEFTLEDVPAQVQANGVVTLGGRLEVLTPAGATLAAGQRRPFLSAGGGLSGGFDAVSVPGLDDGLWWEIDQDEYSVALLVNGGASPGDFNSDGRVDAADYTLWRDTLGQPIGLPNELVTPGETTIEDLATWQDNFGAVATAPAVATPEPGALGLAMLCLIATHTRRSAAARLH